MLCKDVLFKVIEKTCAKTLFKVIEKKVIEKKYHF